MGAPRDRESGGDEGLTLLDRSIPVVLKDPDQTGSRRDQISPKEERLHRLHGTSLIFEASKLLVLGASTYATACTMFHRFYQQASLAEYDVWSVALASILLATKVEEEPKTLKMIIHAFCHLYRKRLLVIKPSIGEAPCWDWNHPSLRNLKEAKAWSREKKETVLGELPLPMKFGPVFEDWHKQALNSEATLLRQMGFTLHWIPDSHPHKFILYFCQALGLTQPQFTQRAWNYCNDSCRLDLCVRFPSEVVATSSIHLAALDFSVDLPISPSPWWEKLVGKTFAPKDIATAANAILGLGRLDKHDEAATLADSLLASGGYVCSLLKNGGSFNDPGSFLWEQLEDAISKGVGCESQS